MELVNRLGSGASYVMEDKPRVCGPSNQRPGNPFERMQPDVMDTLLRSKPLLARELWG